MTPPASPAATAAPGLRARLDRAVAAGTEHLVGLQREDGHWCALLETDVSITCEFLLACRHVGRVDEERERKAVRYLWQQQREDGSWRLHPSGDYSQDTTIKAYFALKAAGVVATEPRMVKARALILEHGGVESAAVFTKIHLAILGQYSWDAIPCIPPEMALLPRTAPFNLYEISYWCRVIMVPLSIVQALKRPGHLPPSRGVRELFCDPDATARPHRDVGADLFSWKRFFYLADRALKQIETRAPKDVRRIALARSEKWTLQHLENSDGLGAIHPAMLNTVYALWMLGYAWDHPTLAKAWDDLVGLGVERDGCWFMQPCHSPIWDTALCALTLADAGLPAMDEHLVRAADWLLAHRSTILSDWRVKAPHATPGAWAFQYKNDHYPDVDDTAMALMALRHINASDPAVKTEAQATGMAWARAMQSGNGGWGAFDRNNNRAVLQNVPFADHGALLDTPSPDLTGRMLELLGTHGFRGEDPAVHRALKYLRAEQEPEGSWFGRWGVNYIYGTWSVLVGLEAIGTPTRDPLVQRSADWLETVQGQDGGWGESPDSYVDRALMGVGASTPSQTAWAMLGLMAAGRASSDAVKHGADWLLEHQREDGGWDEAEWTGTGFPGVLYLKYHYYPLNFPLMALARLRRTQA